MRLCVPIPEPKKRGDDAVIEPQLLPSPKDLCWISSTHTEKPENLLVMVAHALNPSALEAEAGRALCVQGQPGLQSDF